MVRVLVVAAYASVRAGLHALLAEAEDILIVAEAAGSADLEALLPETATDVILVDYSAPDGERVLDTAAASDAAIVLLIDDPQAPDGGPTARLPLRAWAMLGRDAEGPEIAAALRAVAAGLVALDPSIARRMLEAPPGAPGEKGSTSSAGEELTPREREVLELLAEGLPNKAIAARLGISQHTAKFHVTSVLTKLGAASRTEAVALAARGGYLML